MRIRNHPFIKFAFVALITQLSFIGIVRADDVNPAPSANDFPPGAFSDGQHYQISDFHGKVLVIFFYESSCPNTAARMPAYDAIFQKYKDKPVKFIGIGAHDSLADVRGYGAANRVHVPLFADPLSVMSSVYNQTPISLQNVIQFRVIGPDGMPAGFLSPVMPKTEEIDAQLAKVKWKYKDDGYNPALNHAIELLEWNQFEQGVKLLRPFLKSSDKAVADSAKTLYDKVKAEGQEWKDQADKVMDSNPVAAFDLYTKVATVFAGDDLAKSVEEPLKKLKTNKAVTDELAARQQFAQISVAMSKVMPGDKKAAAQVAKFCSDLSAKYPGTPTAAKADSLIKALSH